jgi:hypothetical protein
MAGELRPQASGINRFAGPICFDGGRAPLTDRRDEVGDIVQIAHGDERGFGGCLLVVTVLENIGVQGYVRLPGPAGRGGGDAYYRVERGKYRWTGGKAVWGEASR